MTTQSSDTLSVPMIKALKVAVKARGGGVYSGRGNVINGCDHYIAPAVIRALIRRGLLQERTYTGYSLVAALTGAGIEAAKNADTQGEHR